MDSSELTETTPSVSVIVCTLDRSQDLERAVASLLRQHYPDTRYEIIVVDNGSTDNTADVVKNLTDSAPSKNVKYVWEPELGLSHARNAGVRAAKGEIVAFMDDDAEADPNWLSSLIQVYLSQDTACVGGKVEPVWSRPVPRWLPEELQMYLTIVDMGPEVRETHGIEIPAGTNISFRRSIFDEVGMFDPSLGRVGKRLLSGDEDELCARIERAGHRRYYTPHALVHHQVPPSRLSRRWFLTRAWWQGRSRGLVEGVPMIPASPRLAVGHFLKWLWYWLRRNPKRSFFHLFWLVYNLGVFVGARGGGRR